MRMRPAACVSFRHTSGFFSSVLAAGLLLTGGGAAATRRGRERAFAGAGFVVTACCGGAGLRGNCAAALCSAGDACQPGSPNLKKSGILGCGSSRLSSMEPSEVRVQEATAKRRANARMDTARRDPFSDRIAGIEEPTDFTDCIDVPDAAPPPNNSHLTKTGTPKGNRTPVCAVRGRRPDR